MKTIKTILVKPMTSSLIWGRWKDRAINHDSN
nr:MAG TPA: hypothetical protein [Caudoviricetes sp.]